MKTGPNTPEDVTDERHGLSRRELLKCSAWAGAGVLWVMSGGIPRAFALDDAGTVLNGGGLASDFHFVQISDTHIGFNKEANPEPLKTLQLAIDKVVEIGRASCRERV